jgi:hypothetical protein
MEIMYLIKIIWDRLANLFMEALKSVARWFGRGRNEPLKTFGSSQRPFPSSILRKKDQCCLQPDPSLALNPSTTLFKAE